MERFHLVPVMTLSPEPRPQYCQAQGRRSWRCFPCRDSSCFVGQGSSCILHVPTPSESLHPKALSSIRMSLEQRPCPSLREAEGLERPGTTVPLPDALSPVQQGLVVSEILLKAGRGGNGCHCGWGNISRKPQASAVKQVLGRSCPGLSLM